MLPARGSRFLVTERCFSQRMQIPPMPAGSVLHSFPTCRFQRIARVFPAAPTAPPCPNGCRVGERPTRRQAPGWSLPGFLVCTQRARHRNKLRSRGIGHFLGAHGVQGKPASSPPGVIRIGASRGPRGIAARRPPLFDVCATHQLNSTGSGHDSLARCCLALVLDPRLQCSSTSALESRCVLEEFGPERKTSRRGGRFPAPAGPWPVPGIPNGPFRSRRDRQALLSGRMTRTGCPPVPLTRRYQGGGDCSLAMAGVGRGRFGSWSAYVRSAMCLVILCPARQTISDRIRRGTLSKPAPAKRAATTLRLPNGLRLRTV